MLVVNISVVATGKYWILEISEQVNFEVYDRENSESTS